MHSNIVSQLKLIETRVAAAGLTMTAFLKGAQVSRSTWWRWRNGQLCPGMRAWDRVMTASSRLPWGNSNGDHQQRAAS